MTLDQIKDAFSKAPIVPVLTIPDAERAGDLARTFAAAGLTAVEVTLRTDAALDSIAEMKSAAPSLIVGAGTVLNETDLKAAMSRGADFYVSPGITPQLRDAVKANDAIMIPGVATPSEAMSRYDEGFELLKLFPAEVVGGVALLKALSGPLPHLKFMPTGGVNKDNLSAYLALPNVICIGGSWLAKPDDIDAGKWSRIASRAKAALAQTS